MTGIKKWADRTEDDASYDKGYLQGEADGFAGARQQVNGGRLDAFALGYLDGYADGADAAAKTSTGTSFRYAER